MRTRRHNIPAFALWFLGLLALAALGRDLLANGRPLYCRLNGVAYYPGLHVLRADAVLRFQDPLLDSLEVHDLWKKIDYEAAVFAPIPFSPGEYSRSAPFKLQGPGAVHPGLNGVFRHWLGTDDRGRDVAASMIAGARSAVVTGISAMIPAFVIGLLLGALAGFFGDDRLRLRRGLALGIALGPALAAIYTFAAGIYLPVQEQVQIAGGLVLGCLLLGRVLERLPYFHQKIAIPADMIVMRLQELFNVMPRLIVIIVLATVFQQQSRLLVIALIGAFSWMGIAGFVRAELLRIRALEHITAARGLGLPEWRILWRHALPNALRPAWTALAFGMGSAVLLDATLSFLGYGDSAINNVSWGNLLVNARFNARYWWIAIPPGLAIGLTILSLNLVGDALNRRGGEN